MTAKEKEMFDKGIVYALARLIETFDQPTMALEIANDAGVDWAKCAEYDVAFFREEDPSIPNGQQ